MLKNYWKAAFRNLLKNRAYGFLNIGGLAIGIASAAFIFLWVENETGFNMNFAKHDHLYHVMQNEKNDGGVFTNGSTPGALAEVLKAEVARREHILSGCTTCEYHVRFHAAEESQ